MTRQKLFKFSIISLVIGLILLAIFAWYLWISFKSDKGETQEEGEGTKTRGGLPQGRSRLLG